MSPDSGKIEYKLSNVIVVPVFDMVEDEIVVKQFERIFSNYKIETILSSEIALQGGILNCITWNIKN
jgi:agmatine deiminase